MKKDRKVREINKVFANDFSAYPLSPIYQVNFSVKPPAAFANLASRKKKEAAPTRDTSPHLPFRCFFADTGIATRTAAKIQDRGSQSLAVEVTKTVLV